MFIETIKIDDYEIYYPKIITLYRQLTQTPTLGQLHPDIHPEHLHLIYTPGQLLYGQ